MHAYAAEDPVFRAMVARAQRETDGGVGDSCVGCHAPMALREGVNDDGLNLDEVPRHLRGVTCASCHLINGSFADHNADLSFADDLLMRGGYRDPLPNTAHESLWSPLHDRNELSSASACGPCHDVFSGAGVHVERTFSEWKGSVFGSGEGGSLSCGNCHMPGQQGVAATVDGAPERRVHDHSMPGVDVAQTEFPEREVQAQAVESELSRTVQSTVCVIPAAGGSEIVVRLENVGAGHDFPSGVAMDRRAWVELTGWSGDELILSSGQVGPGEPISELDDPRLWLLRDTLLDEDGAEVHMPWQARDIVPELLPAGTTNDPSAPGYYHARERTWPVPGRVPDRVELRVLMRPMGLEILRELVDSGDLAAEFAAGTGTVELEGAAQTWAGELGDCTE